MSVQISIKFCQKWQGLKENWMFFEMEQCHADKIGLFKKNKRVQKLKLSKDIKPEIKFNSITRKDFFLNRVSFWHWKMIWKIWSLIVKNKPNFVYPILILRNPSRATNDVAERKLMVLLLLQIFTWKISILQVLKTILIISRVSRAHKQLHTWNSVFVIIKPFSQLR